LRQEDVQKWKIVPSRFTNIVPVPGSISAAQNEHWRLTTIAEPLPNRQLSGFARGLSKDQDVSEADRAGDVAGDDLAAVASREHADLDLRGLAGHPGAPHELDNLGWGSLVFRHGLASGRDPLTS